MKTRLRVLRAEVEWSQAELATRVGVTRQTINAIETGKYDPSLPLAIKIARLFGKHVEEIFLYQETERAPMNLDFSFEDEQLDVRQVISRSISKT
jgi:putative transcriptional regulator